MALEDVVSIGLGHAQGVRVYVWGWYDQMKCNSDKRNKDIEIENLLKI